MFSPKLFFTKKEDYFTVDVVNSEVISIVLITSNNSVFKASCDYGEGVTYNVNSFSTGNSIGYTYGQLFNGKMKVRVNRNEVTHLAFRISVNDRRQKGININPSFLFQFPKIEWFDMLLFSDTPSPAAITGDWSQIPNTLKRLEFTYLSFTNTTATVNFNNWTQRNIEYLRIGILCNITCLGDISKLPPSIRYLEIRNGNCFGTIPQSLTEYYHTGANTVTGNLPPNLTSFDVHGSNTVRGALPLNATRGSIRGNNTVSGTIPEGYTYIDIQGNNTLSGQIPNSMVNCTVTGNNTISGTIPPNVVTLDIRGNNTISGQIPESITGLNLGGFAQVTFAPINNINNIACNIGVRLVYNKSVWKNTVRWVRLNYSALTTAMVDQMLIDLSEALWSNEKEIRIIGDAQPRSIASDAAVATLISKGVTVETN